jgi:[ribosomal protein S18]-alanine N-acetyltransferase
MTRIRPLAETDLALVRSWMRDTPEAPAWSDEELFGLVRIAAGNPPPGNPAKTRRAWVAETESRPAGFVVGAALSIPGAPAECELEFVIVPPEARRQGTGSALVRTVLAWARDLGAKEIWLEVRASNARAIGLYQRSGFTIAGRRSGYYVDPSEDGLLMRCRIDCERTDPPV